MAVVSTIKAHEQFKSYSLAKIMGILKSHESDVTKETKVVSGMGSLALISKVKNLLEEETEPNCSEYDLTDEEYALMVSNPKRFARKKFPAKTETSWEATVRRRRNRRLKVLLKKKRKRKRANLWVTRATTVIIVMAKTI